MAKRSEAQQQIYKAELAKHPSHLFDRPLECASIDNDLVGAFYLFKNTDGKVFTFAIKMTQANSPQDLGSFGLWFGEVDTPAVHDRISNVLNAVLPHSSEHIPMDWLM